MIEIVKSSYEKSIYFQVDNKKEYELQIHDALEILFVLTGKVTIGICGKKIVLQQEDIFVVNRYEMYHITYNDEAHTLSLFLGSEMLGKNYLSVNCNSSDGGQKKEIEELKQSLAKMFRLYYKDPEQNREEVFSYGYKILSFLQTDFRSEYKEDHAPLKNIGRFEVILRYINENYRNRLTLKELSTNFFLSEGHISRMFRTIMKMSFSQYVREVRLRNAYCSLKEDSYSITEIAMEHGFATTNMMIDAFRKKYGMAPGKLRKQLQLEKPYFPKKDLHMFRHIMKYAGEEQKQMKVDIYQVNIESEEKGTICKGNFFELLNIGWAKDILLEPIQYQLKQCQKHIGFQYLRCHGIFDDDMMVYNEDEEGDVRYNFNYVDKIYDFLLSIGLRPYVELSYVPSRLATNIKTWFWKNSFVCIPISLEKWTTLVKKFVEHLLDRYGKEIVHQWRFTIMSTIHIYYNNYSFQDYMKLYRETYRALKSLDPMIQIGGPGMELSLLLNNKGESFLEYLNYYRRYNCMPDFFCFQFFHNIYQSDYIDTLSKVIEHKVEPLPITADPDYLRCTLGRMEQLLESVDLKEKKVILECWNSTIWQRDLCNDTCYKSAFLIKNLLENSERAYGFGYWAMSDLMEELFPSQRLFHGGYGMFTNNGVPKSIFEAYRLLKKLGERELSRGNGYFITKKNNQNIQIMLYNYCHYDSLSRQNYFTEGSDTERYKMFQQESKKDYHLKIKLPEGVYKIEHYSISRKFGCGSSYDNWVNIGAPEPMTKEQIDYLKTLCEPRYFYEERNVTVELVIREVVEPHEVKMILIKVV